MMHLRFVSCRCVPQATREETEAEFWRLVEEAEDSVEVQCAANLDCSSVGSGFPTVATHPESPYALHKWNLNNIMRQPVSACGAKREGTHLLSRQRTSLTCAAHPAPGATQKPHSTLP